MFMWRHLKLLSCWVCAAFREPGCVGKLWNLVFCRNLECRLTLEEEEEEEAALGWSAAEMAALGLPSSFVAGLGNFPSTSSSSSSSRKRSRRKKPSSTSQVRVGPDDKHEQDGGAAADALICSEVWLYTPQHSAGLEDAEGGYALKCSAAAQLETSFTDADAAKVPLCCACTSEHGEVGALDGLEAMGAVDSVDGRWEPFWDEQYERYYFCNTRTLESTWEPPPGFEGYALSSALTEDLPAGALVGTQENEGSISEGGRDSGASIYAIPDLVEQRDDDQDGPLSLVEKVGNMADDGEESSESSACSADTGDGIAKSIEDAGIYPGVANFDKPFGGSDESDSCSAGERQHRYRDVDWLRAEDFQSRTDHVLEEEKNGCEVCSRTPQSSPFKFRKHNKSPEMGSKKRRLRSRSEGDLVNSTELPSFMRSGNKDLKKYWYQRYSLFSKYDEGVKLDEEGWFSVTPEVIAEHHASRCAAGLVIDAFTGVGGNAIQFASKSCRVIAIDINPIRIEYARHNAEIYGVSGKIEFVVGDFFELAPFLKADVVFLSPPWGGPEYLQQEIYDLHTMLKPKAALTLLKAAQSIAPNIALFVPRNVDVSQLEELSWLYSPPIRCEVEKNYLNNKLKAITAYYGDIARDA